jgi:CBS domain-containing protein
MMALAANRLTPPLVLDARTAADLMTPGPKSVRRDATVAEAVAFLGRGFSAAPVIDEAGRPVGVVSRTDLLRSQQRTSVYVLGPPGRGSEAVEVPDETRVGEVMTPAVFSVGLDTPGKTVVESLLALNVRRVFVVDDDGVLVGVISAFDVLRGLRDQDAAPAWALSPKG